MSDLVYFGEITESATDFYNVGFTIEEMAQVAGTVSSWCVNFTDEEEGWSFRFQILAPIKGDRESILAGFYLCKEEYEDEDRFKQKEVLPLDFFEPKVPSEIGGNELNFTSLDELINYWEKISK